MDKELNKESLKYYQKKYNKDKIRALGLSPGSMEKIDKEINVYYKRFKDSDISGADDPWKKLKTEFNLTIEEAKYTEIVCKEIFRDDVIPVEQLPPKKRRSNKPKSFNNIDEWAQDRADRGEKYRDKEVFKFIVLNFKKFRQKDILTQIKELYGVNLPAGYIRNVWDEYIKRVRGDC